MASDSAWTSVPTELLVRELEKRHGGHRPAMSGPKPTCGSGGSQSDYNTSIHILALVLILLVSTLACALPLFSRRSADGEKSRLLFICQHFGTGVLIATAFVHLLPTAFMSLTDPCLPDWLLKYSPTPGLVAMIATLAIVAIEQFLNIRGAGHSHAHMHSGWAGDYAKVPSGMEPRRSRRPDDLSLGDEDTEPLVQHEASGSLTPAILENGQPLSASSSSDNLHELSPIRHSTHHSRSPSADHSPEAQRRAFLQCTLLEAGILFHSVFVGMAVSVASGPAFIIFLIAITFHQCFEGLALGARIAALNMPKSSVRPWLMVLAFGITTPFGQAIGLLAHNMYDPASQAGLLMVGFMNAVSAGLLLFAGLVQLLAEDFLRESTYETLRGAERIKAYCAVVAGATLMALVGAFA